MAVVAVGGLDQQGVRGVVIGLGVAFTGLGAATVAVTGMTEASRRRVHVPDTIAALAENPSSGTPLM